MQKKAEFLTITQAAQFLKVSPDTLRRWEDKGIVAPARTKGGSRRYTLLDLKIAKLKRKVKQNYISHRRDLKIALLTSFLWIFGLLIYNFLTPIFLRPTSPQQQILSAELKEPTRLKIASETTPNKISEITVLVLPDQVPVASGVTPKAISQGSDLLIRRPGDLPTLKYTNTINQYYSIQPLPQNQITTLIKRS